jgi:HK97 gp10 family phage protein
VNARIEVDPVSYRRLMSKLGRLADAGEKAIKEAVSRGGDAVRDAAKANAPVDTGELRDSIESIVSSDGLSVEVGTDVPHGVFVELGTSRMAAQPFLFPAFEREKAGILKDMAKSVNAANKAVARK